MKFDFLQSDFSAGEISPRAQGHVESDAFKAGVKLAANVAPTRAGSMASRAGLKFLLEGKDAHTGAASNLPVQHIPMHDGPYGDFIIEVSPTGIRLLDKTGVLPWDLPPTDFFVQYTTQDADFAYADQVAKTIYLRSTAGTGVRSYYLSKGTGAQNALMSMFFGTPSGTNNNWTLSGKIAGNGINAHIVQSNPANFQDIAINPAADGTFSITFRSNIGGTDQDFYIQLQTVSATSATKIWDINLTKNNVKTIHDTTGATRLGLTPLVAPTFGGVNVAPTQERIRAAGFWAQGDFWVAFAGGPGNAYAGFALRWHNDATPLLQKWSFGTLPCTPNSLAQIVDANTVAVYQDRLWYGINLANGKRVIRASAVGFGRAWGLNAQAGSTGAATLNGNDWLFQFIVETETFTVAAGPQTLFTYHFPCVNPKATLLVNVSNENRVESADYTLAGHEYDFEARPDNGFRTQDQAVLPGGDISFRGPPIAAPTGVNVGQTVKITRMPQADDPLDLTLASPTGKIAWLTVLRGLILGTTRNEKLFSRGAPLTVDPAAGQSFDLEDESSNGGDPAIGALDVNDRVLFVQRGRKILRLAGISITSNGGLVSEDIGVPGEHLTNARVRSMCFLRSPVQRVVFAFDDGTGAVMTLVGKGVAFSRFTIPTCFGGIYSVAGLDTENDSELWVGTESGVTLWARTFESDTNSKEILLPNAVPAAPTHLKYDTENPLPPIMDSWCKLPLVNQGGAQYVQGLPASTVGQNAYAMVNGQINGPYAITTGGKVTFPASLALDTTWTDAALKLRAQDIYVGIAYPDHRFITLPLEGGNPAGTAQAYKSRKPQLYVRFVDSYMPLVNGKRPPERGPTDPTDLLPARVTGDVRCLELGWERGDVVEISQDNPLRFEVSAIFGGATVNST